MRAPSWFACRSPAPIRSFVRIRTAVRCESEVEKFRTGEILGWDAWADMTGRGGERKRQKKKRKGYCMTPKAVLYCAVPHRRLRSRSVDRPIAHPQERASSCRWVAGWAGRRAARVGAHVGCRPSGPWSDRTARGTGRLCLLDQGQGLQCQSGRSGAALSQPDSQSSSGSWQGSSQGDPFLALLPFSLSPSSGRRKEGCCCVGAVLCAVRVCERACVCVCVCGRVSCSSSSCSLPGWLELFFSSTVSLPPVAPHRRPLLFPSLHRESLTVSPPNRLVAESTDSLPYSPFLPSPLLYVLTTVTPLKSPLCAFPANSRSPFNPSGRPIYILSANAKIPPRLNPLHLACLALPCLCTNGKDLDLGLPYRTT